MVFLCVHIIPWIRMNLCVDDKDQNFIWNDLNLRCNFHGQLEIGIVSCECLWAWCCRFCYLDCKCSSHIIIANSFDRNNRIHWEKCVMQHVTSTDSRRILHRVHAYVLTLSVYTWIVWLAWLFYCCVCMSVCLFCFFFYALLRFCFGLKNTSKVHTIYDLLRTLAH